MSIIIDDVKLAAQLILQGQLCAIPTETVYGLAADASNHQAIRRVFEAKGRPVDHPLIVHVANLESAKLWVSEFPDWAEQLAKACWPGPLTIVAKRSELASDLITGSQDTVAVRVPNHPKTLELLSILSNAGCSGLVAPSANQFGHVSPTNASHVASDLGEYLIQNHDVILNGGSCAVGIESTIVLATSKAPKILRPGAITEELIQSITGLDLDSDLKDSPKVSGALASHYAPKANVQVVTEITGRDFESNSGFIALAQVPTPQSLTRLAAPNSEVEFAADLYQAMRKADELNLTTIYIVTPQAIEIGRAIVDRVAKAAHKKPGERE